MVKKAARDALVDAVFADSRRFVEFVEKAAKQYRHGDVQIIETDLVGIPDGFVLVPPDERGAVLAEGEATGHAHRIAGNTARIFAHPDGRKLLQIVPPAGRARAEPIRHEQHGPGELPPGIYRFPIKRQWTGDEQGWAPVVD